MADGGEVGRAVALSDAALVLAVDDIEHPMEAVLDTSMLARGMGERGGIGGDRGDVEAGLPGSSRTASTMAMLVRSGQAGWRCCGQPMSPVIQWRRVSTRPWSASVD